MIWSSQEQNRSCSPDDFRWLHDASDANNQESDWRQPGLEHRDSVEINTSHAGFRFQINGLRILNG
jgi:hypothetical protein